MVGDEDLDLDGDIDARDVWEEYLRFAEAVVASVAPLPADPGAEKPPRWARRPEGGLGVRLESGTRWRSRKDGPHVQLPARAANYLTQVYLRRMALGEQDDRLDPGRPDGIPGRRTRAAVRWAHRILGCEGLAIPRGAVKVHPSLWRRLCALYAEAEEVSA